MCPRRGLRSRRRPASGSAASLGAWSRSGTRIAPARPPLRDADPPCWTPPALRTHASPTRLPHSSLEHELELGHGLAHALEHELELRHGLAHATVLECAE